MQVAQYKLINYYIIILLLLLLLLECWRHCKEYEQTQINDKLCNTDDHKLAVSLSCGRYFIWVGYSWIPVNVSMESSGWVKVKLCAM